MNKVEWQSGRRESRVASQGVLEQKSVWFILDESSLALQCLRDLASFDWPTR